jgi:pyocin large subunit-like protein
MSYQAVKWAMKVKTGSIGRKAVLMVIAEHTDKNGANSYPGHDTIAALTETYERKVREHIAALMAARIIKRERRFEQPHGLSPERRLQPEHDGGRPAGS